MPTFTSSTATHQLNLIEQASHYINTVHNSAVALLQQQPSPDQTRINALHLLRQTTLANLTKHQHSPSYSAHLFENKDSKNNQSFARNFEQVKQQLIHYTQVLSRIAQHSLSALYDQNQRNLSSNRAPIDVNFVLPSATEAQASDTKLTLSYAPCLQWTKQQAELSVKPLSGGNFTSSHARKPFALGNSNLVTVKISRQTPEGQNELLYQGFSGPAARVPYTSFKGTDAQQQMLLRAITVINQQEIIETLARETNSLQITEQYTQIVSPTDKKDSSFEKEQFLYTKFATELFDHRQIEDIYYQSRFGCWGVNQKRELARHSAINHTVQQKNQACIAKLFCDVFNRFPIYEPPFPIEIIEIAAHQHEITQLEKRLAPFKSDIHQKLIAYYQNHHLTLTQSAAPYPLAIHNDYEQLTKLIHELEDYQKTINDHYQALFALQCTFMTTYQTEISQQLSSETDSERYNALLLLQSIFELQQNNKWLEPENNFRIQSCIASLAQTLGLQSTKGCKSNNNRGQRLMEKILGFQLSATLFNAGKFDLAYFDGKYQQQLLPYENAHLLLQSEHFRANLGVGGGKCKIVASDHFSDNGLYGKIAKLSKIYKMYPSYQPMLSNNFSNQAKLTAVTASIALLICLPLTTLSGLALAMPSLAIMAASYGLSVITLQLMEHLPKCLDERQITRETKAYLKSS
jgi:inhibitor of growth protein SidF